MRQWTPKPGTLPGRTEVRVLDAVDALHRAGAREVPYLAVYGYVDQRGWLSVNPADGYVSQQLRDFMAERGWEYDYDRTLRECVMTDPWTDVRIVGRRDIRLVAEELGYVEYWHPSEGTVRKRLNDLAARGYIEKTSPGNWALTPEGRHLSQRLRIWGVKP